MFFLSVIIYIQSEKKNIEIQLSFEPRFSLQSDIDALTNWATGALALDQMPAAINPKLE